jgi:phenylalanyl-tRNA synthetase beta chain
MRTTLLPSILETAINNINFRELNQRIFELRRVYLPVSDRDLPNEPLYLAGLLTGRRYEEGWNHEKDLVDFYDAKGVVENILVDFNIERVSYSTDGMERFYHPGKSCNVMVGDECAGSIGELHPDVADGFQLPQKVYYFELNFEKLVKQSRKIVSVTPPSRFPDTFRDIAMLVDDEIPFASVLQCVNGIKIREIKEVGIFDLYKGEHVPPGQKSIAVRVRYQADDRTLTDEEVSRIHERIVKQMVNELKATIR